MSQTTSEQTATALIAAIHLLATRAGEVDNQHAEELQTLANNLVQAVSLFATGTSRITNWEQWAITQGYDPNTDYSSSE